jgi:hypothetical protein
MSTSRVALTEAAAVKGTIVYRGKGATAYRIVKVHPSTADWDAAIGVCKASTATDPTRTTVQSLRYFTMDA